MHCAIFISDLPGKSSGEEDGERIVEDAPIVGATSAAWHLCCCEKIPGQNNLSKEGYILSCSSWMIQYFMLGHA